MNIRKLVIALATVSMVLGSAQVYSASAASSSPSDNTSSSSSSSSDTSSSDPSSSDTSSSDPSSSDTSSSDPSSSDTSSSDPSSSDTSSSEPSSSDTSSSEPSSSDTSSSEPSSSDPAKTIKLTEIEGVFDKCKLNTDCPRNIFTVDENSSYEIGQVFWFIGGKEEQQHRFYENGSYDVEVHLYPKDEEDLTGYTFAADGWEIKEQEDDGSCTLIKRGAVKIEGAHSITTKAYENPGHTDRQICQIYALIGDKRVYNAMPGDKITVVTDTSGDQSEYIEQIEYECEYIQLNFKGKDNKWQFQEWNLSEFKMPDSDVRLEASFKPKGRYLLGGGYTSDKPINDGFDQYLFEFWVNDEKIDDRFIDYCAKEGDKVTVKVTFSDDKYVSDGIEIHELQIDKYGAVQDGWITTYNSLIVTFTMRPCRTDVILRIKEKNPGTGDTSSSTPDSSDTSTSTPDSSDTSTSTPDSGDTSSSGSQTVGTIDDSPTSSDASASAPAVTEKEFKPTLTDTNLNDEDKRVLSGITVTDTNGAFDDDVAMNVALRESTSTNFSFDITFTKNGQEVQPKNSVTVKVPVPEALKGGDIYVYHVENGRKVFVYSEVKDGFVFFSADHFSEYIISSEKLTGTETSAGTSTPTTPSNNPNTGVAVAAVPVVIAVSAAVIIVAKKKK